MRSCCRRTPACCTSGRERCHPVSTAEASSKRRLLPTVGCALTAPTLWSSAHEPMRFVDNICRVCAVSSTCTCSRTLNATSVALGPGPRNDLNDRRPNHGRARLRNHGDAVHAHVPQPVPRDRVTPGKRRSRFHRCVPASAAGHGILNTFSRLNELTREKPGCPAPGCPGARGWRGVPGCPGARVPARRIGRPRTARPRPRRAAVRRPRRARGAGVGTSPRHAGHGGFRRVTARPRRAHQPLDQPRDALLVAPH